jgi:hypothetical protein
MASIDLGYTPRDWQKEVHLNKKRFNVLALHRRAGKTVLAVMELVEHSVAFNLDLGFFAYIAPYLRQAKAVAWAMLKQRLEPLRLAGAIEIGEVELSIKFKHNGSTIRLFGADNPDAMRGLRLDGAVIDEVAQIRPEVWQDVIQPALSDRKGWAIFIGTPNGINLFSEIFFAGERLPEWHTAKYTVYDTDALDEEEVARLKRDMPERAFAREFLCDFAAGGEDQLISLNDVEEAAKRHYREEDIRKAPKVMGVDPARFGDDKSVVVIRQGLKMNDPWVYQGLDNMELADVVARLSEEHQPDAVFIDAGAGSGVIDRLRQLGYDVIEIPFSGRASRDDLFMNKRAEMWWDMKEWLRSGGVIPNDSTLKQELATPTYRYNQNGKRQMESKDQIKTRLMGASTDRADALVLTFAHPVRRKNPLSKFQEKGQKRVYEYDPYCYKP